MIDINYIIENKEHVKELLKRKLYDADIDSLVEDVETKRKLLKAVEDNKAKQNKLSKSVPQVKKEGGDVTKIFAEVKALAAENKIDEEKDTLLKKLLKVGAGVLGALTVAGFMPIIERAWKNRIKPGLQEIWDEKIYPKIYF